MNFKEKCSVIITEGNYLPGMRKSPGWGERLCAVRTDRERIDNLFPRREKVQKQRRVKTG